MTSTNREDISRKSLVDKLFSLLERKGKFNPFAKAISVAANM